MNTELKRSRSGIFDKTVQILIKATTLQDNQVITAHDVCEELDITPRTACRYLADLCADGYLVRKKPIDEQHKLRRGYVASDLTKELLGVNTGKLKREIVGIIENCKRRETSSELEHWQKVAAHYQRKTMQTILEQYF
ncbi:hypothetical protein [Acinetobacter nosocomialis]|uniref:hypothetical protein n=1 Tax=Acinetobacter nosocomialis TaxID=106654 RepID=UPI0033B64CAC